MRSSVYLRYAYVLYQPCIGSVVSGDATVILSTWQTKNEGREVEA